MLQEDRYEKICGCAKGRHSVVCERRGRSKMTQEEYDADVLAEKEEKRVAALASLKEEADEKIEELREKAESYGLVGKAGIDALKVLRPMIREMAELTATELRGLFGEDLAPLGKAIDDAAWFIVEHGVEQKAELVKRMMTTTGLSEGTCLALVLSSSEALNVAIKNAFDNKGDKKK
jgi:hypothetical protein